MMSQKRAEVCCDNLMVFIHCRDLDFCKDLYFYVRDRYNIDPVSPPFGFCNNGVLEIFMKDYIKLFTNRFWADFMSTAIDQGAVTKIVVEE